MWSVATWPEGRAAPPPPPPRPSRRRASLSPRPTPALPEMGTVMVLALAVVAAATGVSAWPAPSSDASRSSAAPPPPERHSPLPTTANMLYELGPDLPDFVKPCRRADPQLNTCLRDSLNLFLHKGFAGIPSLGMSSFDPLEMRFLNLSDVVPGNITLSLVLRGVNVRGFSRSNVVAVRANIAEQKIELTSRVPWLYIDGSFSASGAVLTFPLSAEGSFFVNMTEVSATWIIYYSELPLVEKGPNHFFFDHFEFDFAPVNVIYNFGETLDDDNQLGEAMNEFLNTNAQEVFGDVKTRAAALLGHALRIRMDAFMEAIPANRLLLPD